jgi:hypothetical protein
VTLGAGSVLLAGGLVVWLASVAGPDARRAVAYLGAVAVVGLGATIAVGRFEGVVAVLAVLGGCYAAILVIDEPPLDGRAAIVGACLLAIGELAHLSLAARIAVTDEAGALARRVAWVAVLGLAAMAVGGMVLALVDLFRTGGLAEAGHRPGTAGIRPRRWAAAASQRRGSSAATAAATASSPAPRRRAG